MALAGALTAEEWERIYRFLLKCGEADSPTALAKAVIDGIGVFAPYDTASVYLLDGNGKVCGHHLRGVDERWNKIYLAYYMHTDNDRYSLFRKEFVDDLGETVICNVYNWEQVESGEFVPDFVRERGLLHTFGFGLHDRNDRLRIVFCLDRTHPEAFREDEIRTLRRLLPLLVGLHRNFYYQQAQPSAVPVKAVESTLTARESQIAELLCQSLSPAQISQQLHIAQSTTYKHIANIYAKMKVSSQRQLLSKLLASH